MTQIRERTKPIGLARKEIVRAANRYINRRGRQSPLKMRQLQQAVAIVRHNQLVKPSVLEVAGFNAKKGR